MSPSAAVRSPPAPNPGQVLLAGGDSPGLAQIREHLLTCGYQVEVRYDGKQALRLLEGDSPPLVALLDSIMPGMDGVEICRRLRQVHAVPRTCLVLRMPWEKIGEQGAPLPEADGILLVARLVDDRILNEQRLQHAHAETELFLQSVPSILIGLDAQGIIARWNPMAAEAFGLSAPLVIGKRIDDCGIKWLRPDMEDEVARWLQTQSSYRCDNLAFEFEGKPRFAGIKVRAMPSESGHSTGFIVTGADITERKELEEQLRQAQKLEAIGQLSSGIAHEINTPIQYVGDNTRFVQDAWGPVAALLQGARELRSRAESGALGQELLSSFDKLCYEADLDYVLQEVPKAIQQSLEGVQRVAKIVRAMKDFSTPSSDEKRPVDLNQALDNTITVAKNEWRYLADVITKFDEQLPLVPCLAGEMNQVFLNLIVNAAHAVGEVAGDGALRKGTITITTRHAGQWAEILIADSGAGIPEEIRSRVFAPFFTTKPVGQGPGQGLTLAYSVVVNRHQGKIWFESDVGRGTTFFVRLPLVMAAAPVR